MSGLFTYVSLTISTWIFWNPWVHSKILAKYEQFPQTRKKWWRQFRYGFSMINFDIFAGANIGAGSAGRENFDSHIAVSFSLVLPFTHQFQWLLNLCQPHINNGRRHARERNKTAVWIMLLLLREKRALNETLHKCTMSCVCHTSHVIPLLLRLFNFPKKQSTATTEMAVKCSEKTHLKSDWPFSPGRSRSLIFWQDIAMESSFQENYHLKL